MRRKAQTYIGKGSLESNSLNGTVSSLSVCLAKNGRGYPQRRRAHDWRVSLTPGTVCSVQ